MTALATVLLPLPLSPTSAEELAAVRSANETPSTATRWRRAGVAVEPDAKAVDAQHRRSFGNPLRIEGAAQTLRRGS